MRKLMMLASSAALLGASASAVAAPELYLGAQMGYQSTDLESTVDASSVDSVSSSSGSATADFNLDGVAGGIFAGAKFYVRESLYLATEVNLGTSNADGGIRVGSSFEIDDGTFSDSGSSSSSINAEAGKSYGFGVLLGKDLTPSTSIYGRLGYQRTEYELTESGTGLTGLDTVSVDETFGGIRYGIGLETAMTNNLALRLDWSLTDYSDEGYSESFQNDFGGTETESLSFDPTENLFQVGLSYRF